MSGIKDEHNKLSNQQLIRELKKKRLSKSEKQKKNKEYKYKKSTTAKRKKQLTNSEPKKNKSKKQRKGSINKNPKKYANKQNKFVLTGGAKTEVIWKEVDQSENGLNNDNLLGRRGIVLG